MGKDFLQEVWGIYEKEMASRKLEDYEADPEQMKKLAAVYRFFSENAAKNGGFLDPLRLVPTEVNGGITAYFTVFYIAGDEIARFCEAIKNASALSIDSLDDGTVCISMTIPRVFKHK